MDKYGVISSDTTPQPESDDLEQQNDEPQTKEAADKLEDHITTRLSASVAEQASRKKD